MAYGKIASSSGRKLVLSPDGWMNNEGENLNAAPGGNWLNTLTSAGNPTQSEIVAGNERILGQNMNALNPQFLSFINQQEQDFSKISAERKAADGKSNAMMAQLQGQVAGMQPKKATAPAGYRFTQAGNLEAIPGGPASVEKPLTEFQGKSATYGTRAQESSNIIDQVGEGGKVQPSLIKRAVEGVPLIGGALGMAANATVVSPKQQQIEQAQRDFINANLRQESGAAIADSEFDNARKQYFPQPGDSPEVIKQKAANRETAIKGFQVNAGSGWNRMQQPSQASGMQTGQVVDGYKFLGGNPADKSRWMKVQ